MNVEKKNTGKSCYISQKYSGIQWCQDFNLDEPERIYNICLLTVYERRKKNTGKSCYDPRNTQAYSDARTSKKKKLTPVNHVIYPRKTQAYSYNLGLHSL